MAAIRKIQLALNSNPTREGAGVNLRRVFGFTENPLSDPFLLLDDSRSDDPTQYKKGFPWHPHRGIDTITYVTAGSGCFAEEEESFREGHVILFDNGE